MNCLKGSKGFLILCIFVCICCLALCLDLLRGFYFVGFIEKLKIAFLIGEEDSGFGSCLSGCGFCGIVGWCGAFLLIFWKKIKLFR